MNCVLSKIEGWRKDFQVAAWSWMCLTNLCDELSQSMKWDKLIFIDFHSDSKAILVSHTNHRTTEREVELVMVMVLPSVFWALNTFIDDLSLKSRGSRPQLLLSYTVRKYFIFCCCRSLSSNVILMIWMMSHLPRKF